MLEQLRAGAPAIWLALACTVYDLPDPPRGVAGQGGLASAAGGEVGSGASAPAGGMSASGTGMGATPPIGGRAAGGTGGAPTDGGTPAEDEASAGEGGAAPQQPVDDCPDDAAKLTPGKCGCGVPDVSTPALASCDGLRSKLLHRYDFEGTGTTVRDRVGTAHGTLRSATLSQLNGRGVVLLGGGSAGGYVDLPNQLISSLKDASIEAWVTWGGGNAWQRLFDFGDSTHASPENNPASGKSYLFVTPKDMSGVLSLTYSSGVTGSSEQATSASVALPLALAQVLAVLDDAGNRMKLFLNGQLVASSDWTGTLGALNDVNVWLGRSQFEQDPELSGVLHEVRIYGFALTEAEVASAFAAGPDPTFLAY